MGAEETSPTHRKISPEVVVKNGEKVVPVQIAAVDSLFQDIGSYNAQFSLGRQMGSMLSRLFNRTEGEEFKNPFGDVSEESQQMSASGLSVIHGDVLKNIGLSIEPVTGKAFTVFAQGEKSGSGEARLNITDKGQFSGFLKGLEPEQVQETPLKDNLKSLTNALNGQIMDNYNLDDPSDEALAFLGSLETIVGEYKRLGLDEDAERMGTYLRHSKEGNLREFIAIKNSGMLQEPGKGFGPADWVKDASPEYLERRWTEAFMLLRQSRENPKAHDQYKELLTHLNACLPIARTELSAAQYYTPEHRAALAEVLSKASTGLSGFEA